MIFPFLCISWSKAIVFAVTGCCCDVPELRARKICETQYLKCGWSLQGKNERLTRTFLLHWLEKHDPNKIFVSSIPAYLLIQHLNILRKGLAGLHMCTHALSHLLKWHHWVNNRVIHRNASHACCVGAKPSRRCHFSYHTVLAHVRSSEDGSWCL